MKNRKDKYAIRLSWNFGESYEDYDNAATIKEAKDKIEKMESYYKSGVNVSIVMLGNYDNIVLRRYNQNGKRLNK